MDFTYDFLVVEIYRILKVDVGADRPVIGCHDGAIVVGNGNLWMKLIALHDLPHRNQLQ